MTNIQFLKDRIIFDGHADTRQECETITLMCDNLAKSKDFKTVRYESGYAEFEKVGKTEELKFASAMLPLYVYFDSHITKVTAQSFIINIDGSSEIGDDILATWSTSGEYSKLGPSILYLKVYLENGYELDTVIASGNSETSAVKNSDDSILVYQSGGGDSFDDQIITITTKQSGTSPTKQTIDVSTLSGWANLSDGTHSITIKTKATDYVDSLESNSINVLKSSS